MSYIQLPEEIWIHVFGFLSVRDKLSVRVSCTYFKGLVDHWALWKDSVLLIQKPGVYDTHFWKTLSRRKVKSVVVEKAKVKVLQQIVLYLPWVTSVNLLECSDDTALVTLAALKHLDRLVICQCSCRSLISSLLSLRNLTHLCLCGVQRASIVEIRNVLSQLTNLASLHYHDDKNPINKTALHSLLTRLNNLKHLSLKMGPKYGILPVDYFCPAGACGHSAGEESVLNSLELLNYEDSCLSPDAFSALSSLTKLSVHYTKCIFCPLACPLIKWLEDLCVLSELNISYGYSLEMYAGSIPRIVRRLSLMGVKADLASVRILAKRLPELLHLHLDLCCHDISHIIAEMPQMFPKLQILKVRHYNVPASVFLQLKHLPRLRQLVILDAPQGPSPAIQDLTQKLQTQTNNRVNVLHSHLKDQTTCSCGFY